MILGLDISTSITGITFLNSKGERVHTGYCDMRKEDGFFKKAELLKHELLRLVNKHCGSQAEELEKIYIEQSLQAFRPGLSSAKVLLALAGMNRTISFAMYESFNIEPEYIGASTARKLCGIKIIRGKKAKAQVIEHLVKNEPDFEIEYTKFGNPKAQYFDMADSIVIARAGFAMPA